MGIYKTVYRGVSNKICHLVSKKVFKLQLQNWRNCIMSKTRCLALFSTRCLALWQHCSLWLFLTGYFVPSVYFTSFDTKRNHISPTTIDMIEWLNSQCRKSSLYTLTPKPEQWVFLDIRNLSPYNSLSNILLI